MPEYNPVIVGGTVEAYIEEQLPLFLRQYVQHHSDLYFNYRTILEKYSSEKAFKVVLWHLEETEGRVCYQEQQEIILQHLALVPGVQVPVFINSITGQFWRGLRELLFKLLKNAHPCLEEIDVQFISTAVWPLQKPAAELQKELKDLIRWEIRGKTYTHLIEGKP